MVRFIVLLFVGTFSIVMMLPINRYYQNMDLQKSDDKDI